MWWFKFLVDVLILMGIFRECLGVVVVGRRLVLEKIFLIAFS